MPPLPVVVTRPEPGARTTIARLSALGFAPIAAPLLRVQSFARSLPAPETIRAVLVASKQALPALPDLYHPLPLYTVGDATAATARELGFQRVQSAAGRAEDLAALVIGALPTEGPPLLLATGRHQGEGLRTILQATGFMVLHEEVYAASPVTSLPEGMMRLLNSGQRGWILLFSRETALCLVRLVRSHNLSPSFAHLSLAAISLPVADAVRELPWAKMRVAEQPTETAVLALLHE